MSFESAYSQAIVLGKAWLTTCLENHPSCAKKARHAHIFCSDNNHFITDLSGDGLVPSRLLNFAPNPPTDGAKDRVRLVLSDELDEHTHYATLSHRWGSPALRPLETLSTNIESRINDGVRIDDLPKTYRDAVEITRGMGYENLWIDSLCIIQDSSDDWKREARRMAIIYDNSVFTIAAMDARDSSQGLFPGVDGRVNGLESRAWTCQERMVAPRTLNFTKQSVAWECRQGSASAEAESFEHDTDEACTNYENEDWVPPTTPKAIFSFLRDWRLPPKEPEDKDRKTMKSVMMAASAGRGALSPQGDGKTLDTPENTEGPESEPNDDSEVQQVSKQLSLLDTTFSEELIRKPKLAGSAHAIPNPSGGDGRSDESERNEPE